MQLKKNTLFSLCGVIVITFLAAGALSAQGKIKLKRPGAATPAASATAAPEPEGEYSTSRGPESRKRTLYLGPYLGFNVGGVAQGFQGSPNADGWDIRATLGLRSELYFKRIYGIVLDLGYEQSEAYLTELPLANYAGQAKLRTDFIVMRSMFSYRYSLAKVFSKIKFMRPIASSLKTFAGNLQAGFFAKTPLSAQLEMLGGNVGDPNDPLYDVKSFTRPVSGGLMAGLGFELRLGEWIFFFEGQYYRGLLDSYKPIESRYFITDKMTEHGIYFSSGFKTGIYGF